MENSPSDADSHTVWLNSIYTLTTYYFKINYNTALQFIPTLVSSLQGFWLNFCIHLKETFEY
jgi:hypothetical protein